MLLTLYDRDLFYKVTSKSPRKMQKITEKHFQFSSISVVYSCQGFERRTEQLPSTFSEEKLFACGMNIHGVQ